VAGAAVVAGGVSVILLNPLAHADGLSNTISRGEVIARAHYWLSVDVAYNQSAYHADPEGRNYRTDCSGFISMAWHLDQSRTTANLDDIATVVSKTSMKPGDIMLRRDSSVHHVVLFEKYTNDAHTRANFIAEANTADDMKYYQDIPVSTWSGYTPRRYNKIFDDSYAAGNETAAKSTTGAKCVASKPADPTIDLPNRRDVYFEVDTCVKYDDLSGSTDRYEAWITIKWSPGKDSDDSSDTSKKRFDGFFVHTQLQHNNATVKEVYCYLDNDINASYTGSRTCHTQVDVAKGSGYTADGFVNWNNDGDSLNWLKPWYATGSPTV
jgi:hypothetical protein